VECALSLHFTLSNICWSRSFMSSFPMFLLSHKSHTFGNCYMIQMTNLNCLRLDSSATLNIFFYFKKAKVMFPYPPSTDWCSMDIMISVTTQLYRVITWHSGRQLPPHRQPRSLLAGRLAHSLPNFHDPPQSCPSGWSPHMYKREGSEWVRTLDSSQLSLEFLLITRY
jgi:hypothetical protein